MPTNPLAVALESIELGPAVIVQNLTMIPLIAKHQGTLSTPSTLSTSTPSTLPAYLLLDEALSASLVEITEVSEQGSVPDLKFVNSGPTPVLIVDGEELLGARQNRIVNLTILVPAHSELTIPVSCVEAGRWRARSRSFTSAPRTQYATGRAKRMADVSCSMLARGDRVSDQAGVWDDIARLSSRLNAPSSTSAMGAIFSTHAVSLDAFVAGCQPPEGQVGALFAIGNTLIGFDLFDQPSTLRKILPKLVRGVAVDAIDAADTAEPADPSLVRALAAQFLAVTAKAPRHVTPALGLGEDMRLTAPDIAGAALVNEQRVVHLSAFAL
jgi:hypothetical protein